MTDHGLIARLEGMKLGSLREVTRTIPDAAAALREQAGEIDGWKAKWANTEAALDAKNCEAHDLRIEIERFKSDPLHTHLMAQSTQRLGRIRALEAERDTLASENAGLREALSEFGAHLSDCAWIKGYDAIEGLAWEKCDCGLDAAMEPKSKP